MEYSCSNCDFTYNRRSNVLRHINSDRSKCKEATILVKKGTLECEYCSKTFTQNHNLKRHQKSACKVLNEQEKTRNLIKAPIFKFDEESLNFMYILKEREFLKTKEHVFKLGYTTRDILARSNGYPKGSKIYVTLPVVGNPESKVIKRFKEIFNHRSDIGNEYFEGSFETMFKELYKVVY